MRSVRSAPGRPREAPAAMTSPKSDARRARAFRKWRDAAAVFTALGVVLFASPLVSAFGAGAGDSSVPLAVQFIFNFWAVLIVGAFVLSRLLRRTDPAGADRPGPVPTEGGGGAGAPGPDLRA